MDGACGHVLDRVARRGWSDDTDVFFTPDHGELQGEYGLLFKGPFHTDALMRVPLVWPPAALAGIAAAEVTDPVGHLDLAPTFCAIAGVEPSESMQGAPLPTAPGSDHQRALCEWDSQFPGYGMHMRSIYRDGWLCTTYEPSTAGQPNGLEEFLGLLPEAIAARLGLAPGGPRSPITSDGTAGEPDPAARDPHH